MTYYYEWEELSAVSVLSILARLEHRLPDAIDAGIAITEADQKLTGPLSLLLAKSSSADLADEIERLARRERLEREDVRAVTFPDAAAWLLAESAGAGTPARAVKGRMCLVTPPLTTLEASSLVDELRRIGAGFALAEINRSGSRRRLVLLVSHDSTSEQQLWHIAAQHGHTKLAGFGCGRSIVFAPADPAPDVEALLSLSKIVGRAPATFMVDPDHLPETLMAVVPGAEAGSWCGVMLGERSFLRESQLGRPALRLEFPRLKDEETARKELDAELSPLLERTGSRITLHPGFSADQDEALARRLLQRAEELELRANLILERRDDLEIPMELLRFSQAQLPALAEYLSQFHRRSFPDITYASHFDDSRGAWHYLLYDASAVDVAPILSEAGFGRYGPEPIRFQLDPLWRRDHPGLDGADRWVFVPRGTALLPAFRTWAKAERDEFLGDLAERWAEGNGRTTIPKKAIFVFSGETRWDSELGVRLLDRDGFAPLAAKVGWLNRNLHLRRLLTSEELIDLIGRTAALDQLCKDQEALARGSGVRFKKVAEDVASSLAESIRVVVEAADEQAREFTQLIEKWKKDLHEHEEAVGAFQQLLLSARRRFGGGGRHADRIQVSSERVQEAADSIQEQMKLARRAAGQTRRQIRKLETTLTDLEDARDELESRLTKIRSRRRRR